MKKNNLTIEMKRYCMKRSTVFTYFCHFRNFIVSYISNCMVVMYQSTFFFSFFFTGTAEHTPAHTHRE